jgi:N-acyl-D-amino-acid deacylase
VNAALLVGHSTLRIETMDRTDRPASAREIAAMRSLIAEAMAAGAIGFSTGLDYPPSAAAPTEEVIALARAARAAGGMYCTHMRDYATRAKEALDEAVTIGKAAGAPVVVSHYVCGGNAWPGLCAESMRWMAAAMAEHDLGYDGYPYVGSSSSLIPAYLPHNDKIVVSWSKPHPEVAGRTLASIAAEWACDEIEATRRLAPAGAVYFGRNEAEVRQAIATPTMMFGSDGIPLHPRPHPRLWGTFPRVLGHYARDVGLFTLEQAVHRMTGMTAVRFGLADRGVVRKGAFADLALWSPDRIIDRATYEDPERPAEGIEAVLVNGRTVWRDGRPTGARPGRVLRRGTPVTATGTASGSPRPTCP